MAFDVKYLATIAVLFAYQQSVFSQPDRQPKTGWVKGVILSSTDLQPISFASVMIDGTNFGQRADSAGRFHLRIDSGNVLRITHLSYQTQYLTPAISPIPDHLVVFMQPDSTDMLAPVVIHPWSQDLFLKKKLNDSLNRIARENVSPEKLQALRYSTATDGSESHNVRRQQEAKRNSLSNRVPYFSMLDLVTWYKIWRQRKRR